MSKATEAVAREIADAWCMPHGADDDEIAAAVPILRRYGDARERAALERVDALLSKAIEQDSEAGYKARAVGDRLLAAVHGGAATTLVALRSYIRSLTPDDTREGS